MTMARRAEIRNLPKGGASCSRSEREKMDAISIVEAAYDCESDTRAWFRRLLEQAGPKLDRGFGVVASTYAPNMRVEDVRFDSYRAPLALIEASRAMIAAYPETFHDAFSPAAPSLAPHNTVSRTLGLTVPQAQSFPALVEYMHPLGVRDFVGVLARDPSGYVVFLSAGIPDLRRPTRREIADWGRIAAHISAGARVRRAIDKLSSPDLADGADAVLSPSGSMVHGEGNAQSPDARESLRLAAKSIDRARSKARGNEDEALDLWQGLVAGRWSLIEQFDSDARRFMVARRNDPQVADPRALGLRERQVLAYVAMGHPAKLIAYSLGVSPSSVSTTKRTAMRKLGLQTTADIVRLFAPASSADPDAQER
jgi:DNA-binding CsgD family transcriptional regulator